MKVLILGCGPSGLAVAQAARNLGVRLVDISIFSKADKSKIYGAQYLHSPIPGIYCGERRQIAVKFYGSAEGYRKKVYGAEYAGPVSPTEFNKDHYAWDIRAAYEQLWHDFSHRIFEETISSADIAINYREMVEEFDIVINTIPRRVLCSNPEHSFASQRVYAIGDAPDLGVKCPVFCAPSTLVYNGSPEYAWYRTSNIFGHSTAEWPASDDKPKPPISGIVSVEKPLTTTCDCWPQFRHMGRYGEWKKGVLVHHVYESALVEISKVEQNGIQGALFG